MNRHLDIISLMNSDYYKTNHRLSWHIDHVEYDRFAEDIYNTLRNIKLDEAESDIFNIAQTAIYQTMAAYLSHVYDYILLSKENKQPIYSDSSKIFIDSIWKKKVLTNIFLLDLEKKRFKNNNLKFFYSKMTENIKKNFFKYIVASKNDLIKEFLIDNRCKHLTILPKVFFSINTSNSLISKNLVQKIYTPIISMIDEKYFCISIDEKQSVKFILVIFPSLSLI